jgi:hypothetical protein
MLHVDLLFLLHERHSVFDCFVYEGGLECMCGKYCHKTNATVIMDVSFHARCALETRFTAPTCTIGGPGGGGGGHHAGTLCGLHRWASTYACVYWRITLLRGGGGGGSTTPIARILEPHVTARWNAIGLHVCTVVLPSTGGPRVCVLWSSPRVEPLLLPSCCCRGALVARARPPPVGVWGVSQHGHTHVPLCGVHGQAMWSEQGYAAGLLVHGRLDVSLEASPV